MDIIHVTHRPDDGLGKDLRNIGKLLPEYTELSSHLLCFSICLQGVIGRNREGSGLTKRWCALDTLIGCKENNLPRRREYEIIDIDQTPWQKVYSLS